MDKEEWIKRYKARVLERVKDIDDLTTQEVAEIGYDENYKDNEETPEDAADDELSYWND